MRLVITAIALSLIFPVTALAGDAEISWLNWTVLHRNRILENPGEEQRFLNTLVNYHNRASLSGSGCDPRYLDGFLDGPRPKSRSDLSRNCKQSRYPAPTNRQFDTRWNPLGHSYDPEYVGAKWKDRSAEVRLGLLKPDKPAPIGWRLDLGYTCDWTIDDEIVARNESCRAFTTTLSPGLHQVAIDVFKDGQPAFRFPAEGTQELSIQDHVIAVLGDSFGSGEGNPHTFRISDVKRFKVPGPAKWLDPRCHRSLLSSSGILAAMLADKYKHDRVSLVNFACSGAESGEGILDSYYGRETPNQILCDWIATKGLLQDSRRSELYLGYDSLSGERRCVLNESSNPAPVDIPSQIEQLRSALCDTGGTCDRPDLVVIYIGVNDIRFTDIITRLILKCAPAECEAKLGQGIDAGLASLRSNLTKVRAELDRLGLAPTDPKNIVLVTYPDPMTEERRKGRYSFCDWKSARLNSPDGRGDNFLGEIGALFGLGTTEANAKWAHDRVVLGLNDTLEAAASELGWSVVPTQDIALGHGYCAKSRWFQIWPESEDKQGIIVRDFVRGKGSEDSFQAGGVPSGAMHPNIFGHWNVQAELMKVVPDLLQIKE